MKRRLTKTSSVAAPTDIILENKESEKGATSQAEPEKEGLKAKLLRRKNKKASDSAPPDSPIPEAKVEHITKYPYSQIKVGGVVDYDGPIESDITPCDS